MDKNKIAHPGILIMLHCEQNTGYAIGRLEKTFHDAAIKAGFHENQLFWSYKKLYDTENASQIEIDYDKPENCKRISEFLTGRNIKFVLAFDLGFPSKIIPILKKSGIKFIISYWGASMSSLNSGFKLLLKRLECLARKNKPDLFIFESKAMQSTATRGRGLNPKLTKIVYLGVDTNTFYPDYGNSTYAYRTLDIPDGRKLIFYSGHMEERKGVRVIINAAIQLIDNENHRNVHFIICGNKGEQANTYKELLADKLANQHVTFAGYRDDIADLMRASHIGVIASTGWDSFTMSSIEMMSSGLPLIVSDLQGLSETIAHNENGFLITPGNYFELSAHIKTLIENREQALAFSQASRKRAKEFFDRKTQINNLSECIKFGINA